MAGRIFWRWMAIYRPSSGFCSQSFHSGYFGWTVGRSGSAERASTIRAIAERKRREDHYFHISQVANLSGVRLYTCHGSRTLGSMGESQESSKWRVWNICSTLSFTKWRLATDVVHSFPYNLGNVSLVHLPRSLKYLRKIDPSTRSYTVVRVSTYSLQRPECLLKTLRFLICVAPSSSMYNYDGRRWDGGRYLVRPFRFSELTSNIPTPVIERPDVRVSERQWCRYFKLILRLWRWSAICAAKFIAIWKSLSQRAWNATTIWNISVR